MMKVSSICHANKDGSKKITIPKNWGEVGKQVFIRVINEKELKVYLDD